MKKCLYSKRNQIETGISVALCLLMGFLLIGIGLYLLPSHPESAVECGILIAVGCAICAVGVFICAVFTRDYAVNDNGIVIRYLKTFRVEYPWSSISQISVCDINHAAKDSGVFDIAIRIVVGTEAAGPVACRDSVHGDKFIRWRRMEYSTIYFRTILNVEYSASRLAEIQTASKKDIAYFLTPTGRDAIRNY